MIIQNFDTFFLRWDDGHHEAFFPRERMSDRKIKYMIVANGAPYGHRLIAPSGELCTDIRRNPNYPLCNDIVNLFDGDDKQILSHFSLSELRFMQEDDFNQSYITNPIFKLSSSINPSLSYIRVGETRTVENGYDTEVVPLSVVWDNEEDEPQRSLLRCKTFDVKTSERRINISDITSYYLTGKQVKKIEIDGRNGYMNFDTNYCITDKFLTILDKGGKRINDLPSLFLAKWGHFYNPYYGSEETQTFRLVDDIFYDNLEIDEDLSFIDNPAGTNFEARITFYY